MAFETAVIIDNFDKIYNNNIENIYSSDSAKVEVVRLLNNPSSVVNSSFFKNFLLKFYTTFPEIGEDLLLSYDQDSQHKDTITSSVILNGFYIRLIFSALRVQVEVFLKQEEATTFEDYFKSVAPKKVFGIDDFQGACNYIKEVVK